MNLNFVLFYFSKAFSNDSEYADYDCDSEDESWLNEQQQSKNIDLKQFEDIMDRFEKATGHSTNVQFF